jgi:hypothetical protein
MKCLICNSPIYSGESFLEFKSKTICSICCEEMIFPIYEMAGQGDGGVIHLEFNLAVTSKHNRRRKPTVKDYKRIFNELMYKYNFKCVCCGSKENLSIDHIKPVSKGGTDIISNLQILCKPCNSRKGAKYED